MYSYSMGLGVFPKLGVRSEVSAVKGHNMQKGFPASNDRMTPPPTLN